MACTIAARSNLATSYTYDAVNHLTQVSMPRSTVTQTRTFTYVEDTVEAFVRALRSPEARGEVINVGADAPVSILELAGLVQATLGIPQPLRARFVPYETLPGRYQDVRHRVPDVSKAQRLLGFTAQVPLDEGLRRSLEWHRTLLEREGVA